MPIKQVLKMVLDFLQFTGVRNNFQHDVTFARLPCVYNINTKQKMQWYYSNPTRNSGYFFNNLDVTIVTLVYHTRTNENTNSSYRSYFDP